MKQNINKLYLHAVQLLLAPKYCKTLYPFPLAALLFFFIHNNNIFNNKLHIVSCIFCAFLVITFQNISLSNVSILYCMTKVRYKIM